MSLEQLTTEPASLYAGDTISWKISVPDYPASAGWILKYKAVSNVTNGYFAIVSTADGDDHVVSVAKVTTAAYPPGTYTLTKYVESTTERLILAELTLEVKPDLAGKTAAFDNRSHAEKMLAAIEAVLEGTATTDQQEITIDGNTLKRRNVNDLLKLRGRYAALVWKQRNPGKLAPTVTVTFARDRYR